MVPYGVIWQSSSSRGNPSVLASKYGAFHIKVQGEAEINTPKLVSVEALLLIW